VIAVPLSPSKTIYSSITNPGAMMEVAQFVKAKSDKEYTP
jgi:hypothetical protein